MTGGLRPIPPQPGKLRVVFWGTPGLASCRVAELLEKRGELVGAVEAIDCRSPINEHFYAGILGKLRTWVLRFSPYQKARKAGLPALTYHSSRLAQAKEFLARTKPDVCVVASFPCLIPES